MPFLGRSSIVAAAAAAMVAAMGGAQAQETFRVAVGDAAGGTQHELGKAFIEELEARTKGAYTAKLYLNGQLGDEQNTVNDAAMGLLDFSILAINNVTPFSPTVGLLTLPYVIRSVDDAEKLTQGEIGQELVENTIRDAGVRVVGWAYSGCRVLTNSERPVATPADLEGLVIRVPKNEIMIDAYRSWGVNPTPMAWSETFTALQLGVVDGQDNPYITNHAMKFYEVQKYITDICYIFSIEPLIVSESVFQGLPPEVQTAVLEAGAAATKHSGAFLRAQEESIRADLVAKGMEITEPADGEAEWIKRATEAVWPKFHEAIGGKGKLDQALAALGRTS